MRRALIVILSLATIFCVQNNFAFAEYNADLNQKTEQQNIVTTPVLPSIFIWQLPDDEIIDTPNTSNGEDEDYADLFDTKDTNAEETSEDIFLTNDDDMQLKGYLEYVEDSNAITLKEGYNEHVINLRKPQKLIGTELKDKNKIPKTTFSSHIYNRTGDIAYNIAPIDASAEITKHKLKYGYLSAGTTYNESIDTSDLGFTTSFYTKYENKYFSLKTSYDKNSGVAYSDVIDKFSFAPELKLNKYISIKDVVTSDITRNRVKNEIILSIKPTKDDRVRFEFGANQTFDEKHVLLRSQLNFSTKIKL